VAYPLRGGTGLETGKSIPFGFAGRLTVELASLANVLLAYQKKPLTQVELYAALKAARAELPATPKHFGYGCIAPESRVWSRSRCQSGQGI
jgi:hypothetical protein